MCGIFILIFINKLDCEGKELFELFEEIEDVFGIELYFVMWLIGMGK